MLGHNTISCATKEEREIRTTLARAIQVCRPYHFDMQRREIPAWCPVGQGVRSPTSRRQTHERHEPARPADDEALAQALRWGRTLSHWNEVANACRGPEAISICAQADAAEVQRLAALWTMLPVPAGSDGEDRPANPEPETDT